MSAGRVGVLVQPSRPSGSAVLDDVHPRYQHADELLVRERHFAAVARANMGHRDSHGARQLRGVLATVANGVAAACPGHHSVDHNARLLVSQKWHSRGPVPSSASTASPCDRSSRGGTQARRGFQSAASKCRDIPMTGIAGPPDWIASRSQSQGRALRFVNGSPNRSQ